MTKKNRGVIKRIDSEMDKKIIEKLKNMDEPNYRRASRELAREMEKMKQKIKKNIRRKDIDF